MAKEKRNNIQKITVHARTYIGVLGEGKIENASELVCTEHFFKKYIRARHMDELPTIKFSAVTDYVVEDLNADEQMTWENELAQFDHAKKYAKKLTEVKAYEELGK